MRKEIKKFRLYVRLRVKQPYSNVLGVYGYRERRYKLQELTKIDTRISIFLPRISRYAEAYLNYTNIPHEDVVEKLFTHVVSHEHIHKVLDEEVGREACNLFDVIAGKLPMGEMPSGVGL